MAVLPLGLPLICHGFSVLLRPVPLSSVADSDVGFAVRTPGPISVEAARPGRRLRQKTRVAPSAHQGEDPGLPMVAPAAASFDGAVAGAPQGAMEMGVPTGQQARPKARPKRTRRKLGPVPDDARGKLGCTQCRKVPLGCSTCRIKIGLVKQADDSWQWAAPP